MTIRLGVLMDPIQSIHYKKDSTLAMLWEAQRRGWEIQYFEQQDLFLENGQVYANAHLLTVSHNSNQWFNLKDSATLLLSELDVILMRKDPPFNGEYIYTTHLLAHAERANVLVVNRTQALRDYNEKLFATYFPQCAPPTLVTRSIAQLQNFWQRYGDIVCKPLDGMGGTLIFRLSANDVNANVIFSTLTQQESAYMMAQQFIPEITQGDKRILLIDGKPVPYALARIPQEDWRGNLARGAKGVVQELTDHDQWICNEIGPTLKKQGVYFAGIDIIGNYLTEINITSPTGIRELDDALLLNISGQLFDVIEDKLKERHAV